MGKKGLSTKLDFEFDIEEEMPDLNFDIPLKTKRNKIKIIEVKKVKDSSTNTKLF